ncbi:CLUMA_CG020416, isoform A, partial [Clunio marinus]
KTTVERNRKAEERINLSFPGTKWCGPGNTADGYDDLGKDKEVDACCRQHDHCDNIASGEEKHGLKNDDYFTRLHCQCDKEFKQCLQSANSKRGNYIGNFYFNVRDRCYKEQHPIVECDEIHTKIFIRRCIRYTIDGMKAKTWQWFDLPFYDDEHDFQFDDPEADHFVQDNNLLEFV